MPAGPPVRTAPGDYHFHAYDYAGSAAPDKGPWALSDAQSRRNNLRFYSLVQDLIGLETEGVVRGVPNMVLRDAGGMTTGGRRTKVLSFGNPNAPTVVITGGIHAREWIASEMAYLVAEYLVLNYHEHPQGDYQRAIRNMVDSRNIHIVPMLNPDGNDFTVFGLGTLDGEIPRLWRKNLRPLPITAQAWMHALIIGQQVNLPFLNARVIGSDAWYRVPDYKRAGQPKYRDRLLADGRTGVDLNRNADTVSWGFDCVAEDPRNPNYAPGSETYFGTNRNSETETGNLQAYLAGLPPPATMIDYHSHGEVILYPSETYNSGPMRGDYQRLGKALLILITYPGKPAYGLGSPRTVFGSDATGSITDRAAQRYQTRAFAIELDPDVKDETIGFELPEDRIMDVFEKNIRGALVAIAAPSTAQPAVDQEKQIARLTIWLDWDVYRRGNQVPLPRREHACHRPHRSS